MGRRRGLIDSNVLVASAGLGHQHHRASARLINDSQPLSFATARHCLTEFYNGATRGSVAGSEPLTPSAALGALGALEATLEVLDISADQHGEAIRRFAELGGRGARVYDYLIGHAALVHTIPLIVTWNVKHFTLLFPTLRVATPAMVLKES